MHCLNYDAQTAAQDFAECFVDHRNIEFAATLSSNLVRAEHRILIRFLLSLSVSDWIDFASFRTSWRLDRFLIFAYQLHEAIAVLFKRFRPS